MIVLLSLAPVNTKLLVPESCEGHVSPATEHVLTPLLSMSNEVSINNGLELSPLPINIRNAMEGSHNTEILNNNNNNNINTMIHSR